MGDSLTSDDDDEKNHRFISFFSRFQTLVQLPELVKRLRRSVAGVLTRISGTFPVVSIQKTYCLAFTRRAHPKGGLILP